MVHGFEIGFADLLGVIGFGLYVANYTALTNRWLSCESLTFFCINLSAAVLVLIGLSVNFNLASAMIQTFWIVLSSWAIVLRLIRPRAGRKMDQGAPLAAE